MSPALRRVLSSYVDDGASDKVIVHHVTDTPEFLQLEVERYSKRNGVSFERVIVRR